MFARVRGCEAPFGSSVESGRLPFAFAWGCGEGRPGTPCEEGGERSAGLVKPDGGTGVVGLLESMDCDILIVR